MGFSGLGLRSTVAASLGVGTSRQLLSLCSMSAIRNVPGHYLLN